MKEVKEDPISFAYKALKEMGILVVLLLVLYGVYDFFTSGYMQLMERQVEALEEVVELLKKMG